MLCKHCEKIEVVSYDTYEAVNADGKLHRQEFAVLPDGKFHFCTHAAPHYPSWKSKTWLAFRDSMLAANGPACSKCGKTRTKKGSPAILVVHHLDYSKKWDDPENVMVICKGCHLKSHRSEAGKDGM
jgi:5-methylcytosine-specific restriction endonuclease McrA